MYPITVENVKKLLRTTAISAFLGVGLMSLSACSGSDGSAVPMSDPATTIPEPSEDTIAGTLLIDSEFSILLTLLQRANLNDALEGDNSGAGWTLFAVSDRTFNENDSFELLTAEQNIQLVKNHLYSGTLLLEDLPLGTLPMIEGSVEVGQAADGKTTIGGAGIVAPDRQYSNGVIHIVNSVLLAN